MAEWARDAFRPQTFFRGPRPVRWCRRRCFLVLAKRLHMFLALWQADEVQSAAPTQRDAVSQDPSEFYHIPSFPNIVIETSVNAV